MDTLSLSDLYAYKSQGQGKDMGGKLRFFCPVHGSDRQRSLIFNEDSGWFYCFSCGAKGVVEERKKTYKESSFNGFGKKITTGALQLPKKTTESYKEKTKLYKWSSTILESALSQLESNLTPSSQAARYLLQRGVNLEMAYKYRIGFLPSREAMTSPYIPASLHGRLVFPHYDANGILINFYTRAITNDQQEKIKHYHLEGPKGVFNASALKQSFVVICEGVFDALSCLSIGLPAVAIFGLTMDWQWVKSESILLAFDNDSSGRKALQQFGTWGVVSGKKVYYLDEKFFEGCKDINEVLLKGSPSVLRKKIKDELSIEDYQEVMS